MLREFEQQRGNIQDNELSAQSYHEAFEECHRDGTVKAEAWAHVVSFEEEKQGAGREDPRPRNPNGGTCPLANTDAFITKCEVLTNLWLPAQSR